MARNLTTGAIGIEDVPAATVAFIRRQAARQGLEGDPVAGVTHGLRTDEETLERLRSGPRVEHHTTELLLSRELLVIAYRRGGGDDDETVDPAARVSFHRLDQIELVAPSATKRTLGAADGQGVLSIVSTPVGGPRRATRHVPTGHAPEATRFREALAGRVAT